MLGVNGSAATQLEKKGSNVELDFGTNVKNIGTRHGIVENGKLTDWAVRYLICRRGHQKMYRRQKCLGRVPELVCVPLGHIWVRAVGTFCSTVRYKVCLHFRKGAMAPGSSGTMEN